MASSLESLDLRVTALEQWRAPERTAPDTEPWEGDTVEADPAVPTDSRHQAAMAMGRNGCQQVQLEWEDWHVRVEDTSNDVMVNDREFGSMIVSAISFQLWLTMRSYQS